VRDVETTAGSRFAARRIVTLTVMAIALVGGASAATAQRMSLPRNTNDVAAPHWFLGRLTNATVTNTTP
jgi:hypothetical protein